MSEDSQTKKHASPNSRWRIWRLQFSLRSLIVLITLVAIGIFLSQTRVIRLNGVYRASRDARGFCYEVRFDEEGNVRMATNNRNVPKIGIDSFEGPLFVSRFRGGHYELSGREIRFRSLGNYGSVDYEGVVGWNSIELYSHSNINGFEQKDTFRFISTEPDAQWKVVWPWTKLSVPEDEERIGDPVYPDSVWS